MASEKEANMDQITESIDNQTGDSDDAPEEVNFNSTRNTAQQLFKSQMSLLNRIKRQEQEKRKLIQDRNIAQKKSKIAKKIEQTNKELIDDDSNDEELVDEELIDKELNDKHLNDIEKETQTTKLKIILNDNDQIDKINNHFIKKYKETNNRMISFKDRSIQTNSNIKRIDNNEASRLLHKKRVK